MTTDSGLFLILFQKKVSSSGTPKGKKISLRPLYKVLQNLWTIFTNNFQKRLGDLRPGS